MTRRRPAHRLTSALIGAIVAAIGALTGALLSGRELDTELIAIVSLAAIGGWLLVTALLSSRRPRGGAWAESTPVAYSPLGASTPASKDVDTPPAADLKTPPADVVETPEAPADPPLTAAARKAAAKAKISGTDAL